MEFVKFAVAVVLVLCSVTASNAATAPPSGGGDAHSMPCIQKLMPCQPYLRMTTPHPPATCCVPLKEIVDTDLTCLCSVFNNAEMLKSLNLTKENALVLPKACGANADVSQCKASSGNTPTSPGTPNAPTGSASASSTAAPANSAATINFAGLSFASVFVATLFF